MTDRVSNCTVAAHQAYLEATDTPACPSPHSRLRDCLTALADCVERGEINSARHLLPEVRRALSLDFAPNPR